MAEATPSPCAWQIVESDDNATVIRFSGKLDIDTAPGILRQIQPRLSALPQSDVTADIGGVDYIDDFGAVVLFEIKKIVIGKKGDFRIANAHPQVAETLFRLDFGAYAKPAGPRKNRCFSVICRLGESTLGEAENVRFMLAFIGSVTVSFLTVLVKPRLLRGSDTLTNMEKTGVDALPIVALISFLLGLIMAFMSSMQLRQFGAGVYVASLVSFAMASELGPIMTAIIVAGRSGSAYAAEIGTMKISEEIDALSTMGFDPVLFLAVPRFVAAIIVVPLLTLFSNLFANAGGLMVGIFMLDLTPNTYIKQTIETLTITEVAWGMGKSGIFAALIAMTGCMRGFQAKGGASSVGNAATSAVVTSIFLIILFDSAMAVIRSYWG